MNRTVIGLERLQSAPILLRLNGGLSTDALNAVLDHRCKIVSVIADIPLSSQIRPFHQRLLTPSLEEYILSASDDEEPEETETLNIEGELMSMRKLFVSGCLISIDRLTATNLIHLSLEFPSEISVVTGQSILDFLARCSLLETVLINIVSDDSTQHALQSHNPITLPRLRSIDLGRSEVQSGLITYLRSQPGVAVGFRAWVIDKEDWPCRSV
ncbi:hypothetical protein BJ322DRAFT_1114471 [Thelephora terrestris]|uniref:Uncharacterized protein n=1 Tax=Thelephora terrestris TaxID=56493 RepID=A0A9P6H4C0_9AGAM|nr:hypothetical protein BJ322DRAFT_1114471 [Thelephora terrestris]